MAGSDRNWRSLVSQYHDEFREIQSLAAIQFAPKKSLQKAKGLLLYFLGTGGGDYVVRTPVGNNLISDIGGFGIWGETTHLIVDPGPGAIREMFWLGIDPLNLDGIIISHRHLDHYMDWEYMLVRMVRKGALAVEQKIPKGRGMLLASEAFMKGFKPEDPKSETTPPVATRFYLNRLQSSDIMRPGEGVHRIGDAEIYPYRSFHVECPGVKVIPSPDIAIDDRYIVYLTDGEYKPEIVEERLASDTFRHPPDIVVANIQCMDYVEGQYSKNHLGWVGAIEAIRRLKPRAAVVRSWGLEALTRIKDGFLEPAPDKLEVYKKALEDETGVQIIIPGSTLVYVRQNEIAVEHVRPLRCAVS